MPRGIARSDADTHGDSALWRVQTGLFAHSQRLIHSSFTVATFVVTLSPYTFAVAQSLLPMTTYYCLFYLLASTDRQHWGSIIVGTDGHHTLTNGCFDAGSIQPAPR